jgi:hypothetical protein
LLLLRIQELNIKSKATESRTWGFVGRFCRSRLRCFHGTIGTSILMTRAGADEVSKVEVVEKNGLLVSCWRHIMSQRLEFDQFLTESRPLIREKILEYRMNVGSRLTYRDLKRKFESDLRQGLPHFDVFWIWNRWKWWSDLDVVSKPITG